MHDIIIVGVFIDAEIRAVGPTASEPINWIHTYSKEIKGAPLLNTK
jgi:hypothetical protein